MKVCENQGEGTEKKNLPAAHKECVLHAERKPHWRLDLVEQIIFLVKEPVNLEAVRYLDTDNAICKGNVCTNKELTYAKRVIQAIHLLWFILFMISFKNHVICNVKPSHEEKGQTRGEGHA